MVVDNGAELCVNERVVGDKGAFGMALTTSN